MNQTLVELLRNSLRNVEETSVPLCPSVNLCDPPLVL